MGAAVHGYLPFRLGAQALGLQAGLTLLLREFEWRAPQQASCSCSTDTNSHHGAHTCEAQSGACLAGAPGGR